MEESEQLRKIEWSNVYDGLTVRPAKFGISVYVTLVYVTLVYIAR
jgi:hypothetical protein